MKLVELNRKMNIYACSAVLVAILIISAILAIIYLKCDNVHNVYYEDSSKVNYTVALRENSYFEDKYLGKDNQYISELIEKINANLKYNFNLKEDLEYSYKYKVVANVNVIERDTNRAIYSSSEDIIGETNGESKNMMSIDENIEIDYNKYNNLAKSFVNDYKLNNAISKLTVNMYVGIYGDEESFKKENNAVVSLDIPLTMNTVAIDTKYSTANNQEKIIALKSGSSKNNKILGVAIVLLVTDIVSLGLLIKYIKDSETDEQKYNSQLRKILNNYGSYISVVEDEFDMKNYQILKVKDFVDLLEIRDTMRVPIVMIENKESLVTCFIIPTENNILYFYSLGVTQYALPENNNIQKDNIRV